MNEEQSGSTLIDEMVAALRPLPKHVAKAFLDCFETLLSESVVVFPEGSHVAADGARDGGISLRVLGAKELIAAALAARKLDV